MLNVLSPTLSIRRLGCREYQELYVSICDEASGSSVVNYISTSSVYLRLDVTVVKMLFRCCISDM